VRLWDLHSGQGRVLGTHAGRVHWLSFSPDGARVGAASSDHRAVIWEIETGEALVLEGHRSEVNDLVFSPDGRLVATASDDETVRVWNADSGAAYWRAPIMLPRAAGPPLLFTHEGWSRLDAAQPAAQAPEARWRAAVETAAGAAVAPGGDVLCVQDHLGHLELWELTSGRRVQRIATAGIEQVVATPAGCAVLAGGSAIFFDRAGTRLELAEQASALAWDGKGLLIAADREITSFTPDGRTEQTFVADLGVTAMQRIGPWLVLGYRDGSIERVEPVGGGRPQSLLFAGGPASPVVSLLPGPMGMVIAGHSNGLVGLWRLRSGARFDAAKLHGPVVHLQLHGGKLFAATALGDHMVWDMHLFNTDYCEIVREVWQRVAVVWEDGRSVPRAPPSRHRCSTVAPRRPR